MSLSLLAGGWAFAGRATGQAGVTLRVAIVQAGRFTPGRDGAAQARQVFERYAGLSRQAARRAPRLIIWPEASVPATLPSDRLARAALAGLARELQVHLLVASSGRDKSKPTATTGEWANSAFLFAPDGKITGRYDKVRLLPFNEYLPLRGLLRWPGWIATEMVDAKPGEQRTLFDVDGWRFGALICWENLFASEFRDAAAHPADFMVSLTNESFAPVGPGREQLLALNAMRALENGLYVVRAATTGISGFIAPDGAILERVADERARDLDVTGFRVLDVPVGRPTPYRRYGDWIVALEAAILLVVVGAGLRRVRAE